jgi:hypothetical protein
VKAKDGVRLSIIDLVVLCLIVPSVRKEIPTVEGSHTFPFFPNDFSNFTGTFLSLKLRTFVTVDLSLMSERS